MSLNFLKLTHKLFLHRSQLPATAQDPLSFSKEIFVLLGRIVNGLAIHDCR
jgi:hypothetical protein